MCDHGVMALNHDMLQFRSDRIDTATDVLAAVDDMRSNGNARAWVTLSPYVDPADMPVTSVLRKLFSARGTKVPEVTFVPANGDEPAQIGVLHAAGPRAVVRLVEAGVELPDGWAAVQDHTRRGLLFNVAPQATSAEIIAFGCRVGEEVSVVPTDERWIARVSSAT